MVRGMIALSLDSAKNIAIGCQMHTLAEWATHPQGRAVNSEPLLHWTTCAAAIRTL